VAWTLNISPLFDGGKYYEKGLVALNGSIFSPPNPGGGGAPRDTVTSTSPPSFLSLPFASATVPPVAPGTVLVTDSVIGGDLVRSGAITPFPASGTSAPLVTAPPALISAGMVDAAVAAWAAREGGSLRPTMVPYWIRLASGLLTAGINIPLVVSAGPPTVALGDGTFTVTVPVFVVTRQFYFFVRTLDLTLTLIYTPAPSHDPAVPSRVLNIGYTSRTLSGALGQGPLGAFVSALIAPKLESAVNDLIVSTARAQMRAIGYRPSPTAVFSARKVTITAGGVNLQIVLADVLGPAIVPLTPALAVTISPTPKAGVQRTYTVTVTNSATGAAVPGATVTLDNYDATGASRVSAATTNQAGQATLNVTLRVKTTATRTVEIDIEGVLREVDGESVVTKPLLTVSAAGFSSVMMTLL
jgi:hypothetical protein